MAVVLARAQHELGEALQRVRRAPHERAAAVRVERGADRGECGPPPSSAAVGVGLGRRSGCSGRAGGGAGAGVLEGRVAVGEAVEALGAEAGGAFSLSEASDSSSGWVAVACEAVGDC